MGRTRMLHVKRSAASPASSPPAGVRGSGQGPEPGFGLQLGASFRWRPGRVAPRSGGAPVGWHPGRVAPRSGGTPAGGGVRDPGRQQASSGCNGSHGQRAWKFEAAEMATV